MKLSVTNGTLHYLEFGKGEPLVLVPSMWVTSRSYRELGSVLGERYHVYIPDIYRGKSQFAGTAKSIGKYAEMLNEFICGLEFNKYYLIGTSLSGVMTSLFIRQFPNRPKKLFLVSTTVVPFQFAAPAVTLIWGYIKLFFHNLFSRTGIATDWLWFTDGLVSFLRHPLQFLQEGYMAISMNIEDIRALPVPTKLIFAHQDEFVPLEAVERMQHIRNLQIEVVDGHHCWFFGREKELAKEIVAFFGTR